MVADAADEDDDDGVEAGPAGTQRLDKWLWFVRVVKTRSLAQRLIEDGGVRVNRARITKTAHSLKVGDVVTVSVHRAVRVLQVKAPGVRRGSPDAAQLLYTDLTPPPDLTVPASNGGPMPPTSHAHPMAESGRPDKRGRRQIERLKGKWRDA